MSMKGRAMCISYKDVYLIKEIEIIEKEFWNGTKVNYYLERCY